MDKPGDWADTDPITDEVITRLEIHHNGSASEQLPQRVPSLDLELSGDGCDTTKPGSHRPSAW